MPAHDKMFSLRIPEKLLDEYREFCEENSINISKRLRKFIERDLEGYRAKKLQQQIQQQQKNNSHLTNVLVSSTDFLIVSIDDSNTSSKLILFISDTLNIIKFLSV